MRTRHILLLCAICGPVLGGGVYLVYLRLRPLRPNVVILLMDTLRADHLGCYGYHRAVSPVVDALADSGAVFTRCYAAADYTQASTASLFTGQYPLAHGYVNSNHVLEEGNLTAAEILQERGYATAAFVANGLAGKKYHMDQGFDEHFEKRQASAEEMFGEAADFVSRHRDHPFFIYMHFMEVHDPYRIPESYRGRFADPREFAADMQDTLLLRFVTAEALRSKTQDWWDDATRPAAIRDYVEDYGQLYDAAIYYWDETVGSFLGVLEEHGVEESTIVVVIADHGEQLLEHGYFGHGNSGYDVGLHVPFILRDPLNPEIAGARIDDPVSVIDVLPTLLARLGIEIPPAVQGRERWSLIEASRSNASSSPAADEIYTEGTFFANRPFSTLIQTYREGGWKLILDRLRDTKELYHVETDPGETRDLFSAEPEVAARLRDRLGEHYSDNLQIFNQRARTQVQQKAEKLRELMALGYLAGQGHFDRPRVEYFPMKPVPLAEFGPFGDEEDLDSFTDRIDFSEGPVAGGQVIRGFSDRLGRQDTLGVWFDRRATFLLPNAGHSSRIVFDIRVDSTGGVRTPTEIGLEFDGEPGEVFKVDGPGRYELAGDVPPSLQERDYFYAGLRANNRFVLREASPAWRSVYGSMRIRSVRLVGGSRGAPGQQREAR